MSDSDQFWRYAEEAMLDARHAKNETEKRALLALARSWTQAALQSDGTLVVTASLERAKATKVAATKRAVAESQIVLLSNQALFTPREPIAPDRPPPDEPDKSPVEEPARNNPQEDRPMRDPQQPDSDKPRMM